MGVGASNLISSSSGGRDAILLGTGAGIGAAAAFLLLSSKHHHQLLQQRQLDCSTRVEKQQPQQQQPAPPRQQPPPPPHPQQQQAVDPTPPQSTREPTPNPKITPTWSRNSFKRPPIDRPTHSFQLPNNNDSGTAAVPAAVGGARARTRTTIAAGPAGTPTVPPSTGVANDANVASREIVCAEAKWYLEQPEFARGFPAGVSVMASLPDVSETPWDLETWRYVQYETRGRFFIPW